MTLYTDRYDFFVFDLDGTLADTREDLATSLNHALVRVGLAPLDVATVTRYVGDGARMLVERALGPGATADRLDAVLAEFIAHYREHCTDRTVLYPGADETVRALRVERGKTLAILTNKPAAPSRRILEHLGVAGLFGRIEGGDTMPARKPDPAGLVRLVGDLGQDLGRTLVVGDSGVDTRTAHSAGVPVAFVTYGFRPEARFEEPPEHVIDRLPELLGRL